MKDREKEFFKRVYHLLTSEEMFQIYKLTEREKQLLHLYWGKLLTFEQIAQEMKLDVKAIGRAYNAIVQKIISSITKTVQKNSSLSLLMSSNIEILEQNILLQKQILKYQLQEIEDLIIPVENISENLKTPISDLKLLNRTNSCLYAEEIQTVDDLMKYSERDLSMMRNVGKKTIEDINKALATIGLQLRK